MTYRIHLDYGIALALCGGWGGGGNFAVLSEKAPAISRPSNYKRTAQSRL